MGRAGRKPYSWERPEEAEGSPGLARFLRPNLNKYVPNPHSRYRLAWRLRGNGLESDESLQSREPFVAGGHDGPRGYVWQSRATQVTK